jgi:hypothetical protein
MAQHRNVRNKGRERIDRSRWTAVAHPESGPILGQDGLSVYREATHPSLDLVSNIFKVATRGVTKNTRGQDNKLIAINLLNADEVRRQQLISDIEVSEAQSHLYNGVGSLRRKTTFYIGSVGVLHYDGPYHPIALLPDGLSRSQFTRERQDVLEVLEGLTDYGQPYDFKWRDKRPLILLGQVGAEIPGYELKAFVKEIKEVLPDQLPLDRATIL